MFFRRSVAYKGRFPTKKKTPLGCRSYPRRGRAYVPTRDRQNEQKRRTNTGEDTEVLPCTYPAFTVVISLIRESLNSADNHAASRMTQTHSEK